MFFGGFEGPDGPGRPDRGEGPVRGEGPEGPGGDTRAILGTSAIWAGIAFINKVDG